MDYLSDMLDHYHSLQSRKSANLEEGEVAHRPPDHDLSSKEAPKRKKRSARGDVGGNTGPIKRARKGGGEARLAVDDIFGMDDTTAAERFVSYAEERTWSYTKRMQSFEHQAVARTHLEKGGMFLWTSHKNTVKQLRENAASARKGSTNQTRCSRSLPRHGFDEIEEKRCAFIAAHRGLKVAERRLAQAQRVERCSLDAARAQITARTGIEENLRLALAQCHPYWDLVRRRLEQTLRQSIADTAALVKLSKMVALSHASCTAIAQAKVAFFSREKLACRYNREVVVCRVNGTGDSSGEALKPLRFRRVKCRENFSVHLPRVTKALDMPQASVPDPGVSPRMGLVLSQLNVIASAAAKRVAADDARVTEA